MEFLKGAVKAGSWGCLVSLVLGLLWACLAAIGGEWNLLGFVRGGMLFAFVFGVWLVPISVLLGLVYVIIRHAVRLERGGDAAPRS